ncbi:ArnT family glycosyltransferase [Nonomuraea antimicrobica]
MEHVRSGRVLAALSVLPALAVAGWLLAGLPLLLLGRFAPVPAVLFGVPLAAVLCWVGTRRLGVGTAMSHPHGGDGREAAFHERGGWRAWWPVAGVVGVAVASGVSNLIMHSEQVAVRRDPATYAQYTAWIAAHGSLPVSTDVEAFGGPDPGLVFRSMGFYDVNGSVVPQFMPGPPLLFAIGDWLGAPFAVPAVLGALAVLTLAGVVARLAGARWAVVAATALAVSLPILYTSRTTFSEIPSLILLFGGLALAYDALARPHWGRGLLAGLVFGLAVLVRVDGLRDVLPVLAFAGLLIAMRRFGRPQGAVGPGLMAGLVVGAGIGMSAAYVLARPYLSYLSGSVQPLLAICAAVLVLTLIGTAAAPALARVRLPGWAPAAGGTLVVLLMAALYARPWFQTVTRVPVTSEDVRTAEMIEGIQRANGLPPTGNASTSRTPCTGSSGTSAPPSSCWPRSPPPCSSAACCVTAGRSSGCCPSRSWAGRRSRRCCVPRSPRPSVGRPPPGAGRDPRVDPARRVRAGPAGSRVRPARPARARMGDGGGRAARARAPGRDVDRHRVHAGRAGRGGGRRGDVRQDPAGRVRVVRGAGHRRPVHPGRTRHVRSARGPGGQDELRHRPRVRGAAAGRAGARGRPGARRAGGRGVAGRPLRPGLAGHGAGDPPGRALADRGAQRHLVAADGRVDGRGVRRRDPARGMRQNGG